MRLTNESVFLFVCSGVLMLSTHASLHGNGFDGGALASALDSKQTLAQNADVIPINMLENHIYVKVRVNGSLPLSFILDTGASNHFLNEGRAEELGILHKKLGEHNDVGTGEGATKLAAIKNVSLNMGGIELKDRTIYVVQMDKLEAIAGHSIDGILGAEIFNRFVVGIDYLAQTVTLSNPENYKYSGRGEIIPLKLSGNRPFVKAKVAISGLNPIEGLFVIDIGDSSALSLHTPFVAKNKLLPAREHIVPHFTNGLGGESREWLGRAQNFQLGRYTFKQPVTAFSQATKGSAADSSYDGAIGAEILRRFKIIFDYTHKQMILESNAGFDEPFEADMSGVSLLAESRDFKTIRVNRVLENSPGAESGLRNADVLVTIDGNSTEGFTLEQIKQMFKNEGREYLLNISRDEHLLQVKIKMRRLI